MDNRKITEVLQKTKPRYIQRVCAYVRVSTDKAAQLASLENQTQYYERLITSNPIYEYCGIFSDAGISGAKENRPGFQAMLEKARNGEIDIIITKSISRFARNTVLLLKSIRELKSLGVAVIFDEQYINTLSGQGEMLLTLLASIAEEERKSVSGNVSLAIRNRFKQGFSIFNTSNLLGYTKDEDGNIVIDKKQAKIVRKIYRLYLEDALPEHIATQLNKEKTPTYTPLSDKWDYHRVRRILSNEKYMGDCCLSKFFNTTDGKTHKNKGEMPKYYIKNHHIPIVSRSDWKKVQERMNARKKVLWPFTSKLLCPYCGAVLFRQSKSYSNLADWACRTYLQKGKSTCKGVRVPEQLLYELTKNILPLEEQMIVLEVSNGEKDNNTKEKSFSIVPVSEYRQQ